MGLLELLFLKMQGKMPIQFQKTLFFQSNSSSFQDPSSQIKRQGSNSLARILVAKRASSEIVTARQTENRCDAFEAKFRQINKEQSHEQIGLVGWLPCYYFLPMALTIFLSEKEKMPLSSLLLQDFFPLMTEFRNRNYLQGKIVAVLQYHPTGMRLTKFCQ